MTETTEMWTLMKLLKGIDTPYWLTNRILFKYPAGYAGLLQTRFNELLGQWRATHPYDLLNGGET